MDARGNPETLEEAFTLLAEAQAAGRLPRPQGRVVYAVFRLPIEWQWEMPGPPALPPPEVSVLVRPYVIGKAGMGVGAADCPCGTLAEARHGLASCGMQPRPMLAGGDENLLEVWG